MPSRRVRFAELVVENLLEIGAGRPRSEGAHLPVLRVADVLDGHVQPAMKPDECTAHRPDAGPKASRPGDIVLTTKGTVGRVAIMPSNGPTYAYSPQLCYFRPLDDDSLAPRYLYYWFKSAEFWTQADAVKAQTDMADFISLQDIYSLRIGLPSISEQRAIAEVLGALDDKIAANTALVAVAADLSVALFQAALRLESEELTIAEAATLIARGITPKYVENGSGLTVLNQKCIRDHRVMFGPARRTEPASARIDKLLVRHDVLVNSTGQGTLGRIARWTSEQEATVDSHISIVRFNPAIVDPACAGFAVLAVEHLIEQMGEGSTGQTELARGELAKVELRVPARSNQLGLSTALDSLTRRADAAVAENDKLSQTRDALLPALMSGRIHVKDAERSLAEVL